MDEDFENIPEAEEEVSGFGRPEREMHTVICAECGMETEVPFKPDGERPVYCRDCYRAKRGSRGGGSGQGRGPREMHTVVCAECGMETEVPFKPDGERPVYCRDCYQKHRPSSF